MPTTHPLTATPVIRVETERIPKELALRLGAAAYKATLEWVQSQEKQSGGNHDEEQAL